MSGVRVLVGTRKGAFIITSDGKREQWDVAGPHFGGWEMYHLKGSPGGVPGWCQVLPASSERWMTWPNQPLVCDA